MLFLLFRLVLFGQNAWKHNLSFWKVSDHLCIWKNVSLAKKETNWLKQAFFFVDITLSAFVLPLTHIQQSHTTKLTMNIHLGILFIFPLQEGQRSGSSAPFLCSCWGFHVLLKDTSDTVDASCSDLNVFTLWLQGCSQIFATSGQFNMTWSGISLPNLLY